MICVGLTHEQMAEGQRRHANSQNAAKSRVAHAIRKGFLKRGKCEMASARCKGRIEGHHDDYAKPLEVRWLCARHHKDIHMQIGACSVCRTYRLPEVVDGQRRCVMCHAPRALYEATAVAA